MKDITDYIKVYNEVMPLGVMCNFIKSIPIYKLEASAVMGPRDQENHNSIIDKNVRDVEQASLLEVKSMTQIHWRNYICYKFSKMISRYKKEVSFSCFSQRFIQLDILKYRNKGFYTTHIDDCERAHRELSILYFLNNDYQGGELNFHHPNGTIFKTIRPQANTIAIFPSNFMFPHSVSPVINGTRYAVVGWTL